MKSTLILLFVTLICISFISCENSASSQTSISQEETSPPTSISSDDKLPEQKDKTTVFSSDLDKKKYLSLIKNHQSPSMENPSWALDRPTGIELYYGYEDGMRISVHPPIESDGPGIGQLNTIYVSLETTIIAYRPSDEATALKILVCHDKGQTWETLELPIEELGKYTSYHIAFKDKSSGLLILCDGENNGVTYSTANGGSEWSFIDSFISPECLYDLTIFNDLYYFVGRNDEYPVMAKSSDGVHWEKMELLLDKDSYVEGLCVDVSFDDNIGLAVVSAQTVDCKSHILYFATADYGENWVLYTAG